MDKDWCWCFLYKRVPMYLRVYEHIIEILWDSFTLNLNMIIQSGLNFAQTMAAKLPWHVQNFEICLWIWQNRHLSFRLSQTSLSLWCLGSIWNWHKILLTPYLHDHSVYFDDSVVVISTTICLWICLCNICELISQCVHSAEEEHILSSWEYDILSSW